MTRTHMRRAQRRESVTPNPPALEHAKSGRQQAENREILDTVLAALGRLPETQRETATLFYINGYSQQEIGAFTGRRSKFAPRRYR